MDQHSSLLDCASAVGNSPPLGNISRRLTEEASKAHGLHRNGLIVCRWRWRSCSLIPTLLLFLILCCFSHLTFQVTSQPLPTSIAAPAGTTTTTPYLPASPIKNNRRGVVSNNTHQCSSFESKIAVGIGISVVFVAVILVMGCLKYFRFKIRRKRIAERVAAVIVHVEDDGTDENACGKSGIINSGGDAASVRRFRWDEMKKLTVNFSMVIGSGGFSTVYLAHFPDSTLGAIKIQSSSERLNRVYKQELEILLHIRHDNIVKFLGYCDDREEGILVFEYVSNGNLQEKLHGNRWILPWKNRMVVAFQLAQAMEYLHEKCTLHIVHGDIKSSNILLDENLNCKLCDLGSAKMGFSSTLLPQSSPRTDRTMLGSLGYVDPQYLRTGIACKKNDIYSFGVIILELITGKEAFSSASGERLTSTSGPMLGDPMKVKEMVDPCLAGDFNLEEAIAMASISSICLRDSPIVRHSASDILQIMRSKIPSISLIYVNELQKPVMNK